MSLGAFIVEQEERQKAYERAMSRYHARKAREEFGTQGPSAH